MAALKPAISTDAHCVDALGYMRVGVDQARRRWLTADDVFNTRRICAATQAAAALIGLAFLPQRLAAVSNATACAGSNAIFGRDGIEALA